jgi:hypothetical protein
MSLKRLTPTRKYYELVYLVTWQDELAEIVRLTRQLPNASVRIEADGYELDEVETDLPKLGSQLNYFSVTVTKDVAENDTPRELLSLRLSTNYSWIKATDPDLATMGLIDQLRSLTERCSRKPRWMHSWGYRDIKPIRDAAPVIAGLGLFIIAFAILAGLNYNPKFYVGSVALPPFPFAVGSVVLSLLLAALLIAVALSRTILFTGTRDEAPTWWQRHRAEIAINVSISVAFYFLGLLTAHL